MLGTETLSIEAPYVRRARRGAVRHRLFCFPHAGAGASYYASWPGLLPSEVELIAIQLPGREDRSHEQAFVQVAPLVRTLLLSLRPYLRGSFSFFGHSGGALLAYELAHALHEKRRTVPAHLFLSGQLAPDATPAAVAPLHMLPDLEFRAAVDALGGLTDRVAGNEDLMSLLIPTLRADFALWENHAFQPYPPLPIPITALGGRADERVPEGGLKSWRGHTTTEFRVVPFEGDHFYLNGPNEKLLSLVSDTTVRIISAG